MGTRAAFFVGDPRKPDAREWLGCIAWDGYPEGNCKSLLDVSTEFEFRTAIAAIKGVCHDHFADPAKGGFPFPWVDDLFLTDYVYAWFDGAVHIARGHDGLVTAQEYRESYDSEADEPWTFWEARSDPSLKNIPAPGNGKWDQNQPDSIMVIQGGQMMMFKDLADPAG